MKVYLHVLQQGAADSWNVFRQKPPTIRVFQLSAFFPTIRGRLGKCALIGQFKQYIVYN